MTLGVWQQTVELAPEVFWNSSEYLKIKVLFFHMHFMVNLVGKIKWVFLLFQIWVWNKTKLTACETLEDDLSESLLNKLKYFF